MVSFRTQAVALCVALCATTAASSPSFPLQSSLPRSLRANKCAPTQCKQKKFLPQDPRFCRDHSYADLCDNIVDRPKDSILGKTCTCFHGKWEVSTAVTKPTEPTEDGPVDAKFIGNIITHAKTLCTIVEAIDCWQNIDPKKKKGILDGFPDFGKLFPFSADDVDGSNMVPLTANRDDDNHQAKFVVSPTNLLKSVKMICKIIDGGVGALPGLLPGLKDKIQDGSTSLLEKLLSGGGIDFSDIFQVEGEGSQQQGSPVQVASSGLMRIAVKPTGNQTR